MRPRLTPAPFHLKSASHDHISVRGMAELMIQIEGKRMLRPFCIIDSPYRRCIIGADTLSSEDLFIHAFNHSLHLQTGPVRLSESLTLEPYTEKLVSLKIPLDSGSGVIKNCPDTPLFDDGLVKIKHGSTKVVVQNPTNFPIQYDRNSLVGKFEQIPQDHALPISKDLMSLTIQKRKQILHPQVQATLLKDLDLSKVPDDLKGTYRKMISSNSDVFSINPNDIGRTSALQQKIRLKDPSKVACIPPYRTPFHLRPVVEDYVQKLLASGVVQKSNSPFSSPLMLVRKANARPDQPLVEQYRVVHDYRQLNANTVKDSYPMHNLYDLIDRVSQAKIWSVIDLSSGFWNQELETASRPYTAFGIPGMGHFEYTRSAQGLCNSPPSFQRLLDFITKDMPQVHVYVDDVVICSESHEEHLALLQQVFDKFRDFNLKCRLKKVQLGTTEINYLGYNLSKAKGIRAGLAKTEAVRNWNEPSTVKEIKQFLGLGSFFRRTIRNFASIASPLTKLTRKDNKWGSGPLPPEARNAFRSLQQALCRRPCLTPVNFNLEFILTVDASQTGLGAILSQQDKFGIERPCAYASRTLTDCERKRAPFHLEYLAMVWACKHFKPYLSGKHFIIRTDHKPLEALNKTQGSTFERLQMELDVFQPYTIQYLPGEKMPADGLSRLTEGISVNLNVNHDQLVDLQQQDVQAKALFCYLKFQGLPDHRALREFVQENASPLTIKNGLLGSVDQDIFVPYAPRSVRDSILRLAHDDMLAGHASKDRTKSRISRNWTWPTVKDDVEIYCRSCHVCNTTNVPHNKMPLPLEPFMPVSQFNQRVHMDLLGPLPLSQGNKYLLVMIDSFSKLLELAPLPNKEMETVSGAYFDHWICRHGVSDQIHSDLGKEFANQLFTSLAKRFDFSQTFSSVSHPQSNGQAERQIRSTIGYLRKYLEDSNDWTTWLPSISCAHNTSVHTRTKYSPFMAAYTRLPRLPLSLGPSQTYSDNDLEQKLALASKIKFDIMKHQQAAFETAKMHFDKRSRSKHISLGDVVYVVRSKRGGQFQKFQPLYEGPYRVEKHGNHQNVYIVPVNAGDKIRKSLWVHPNILKLAPFSKQITTSGEVQEDIVPPRRQQRPQYTPKPPPVMLPSFVGDPEYSENTEEQRTPENALGNKTPIGQNALYMQGVDNMEPTNDGEEPDSETAAAAASVHEEEEEEEKPAAAASPVKTMLRSLARKTGMRLPSSTLSVYPDERKKRVTTQSKETPGLPGKKLVPKPAAAKASTKLKETEAGQKKPPASRLSKPAARK